MLCFEVYRNGEKLYTAGIGEFGVLNAMVGWVSHSPEKMAKWEAEGLPDLVATGVTLDVGGLLSGTEEHRNWPEAELQVGDEVTVRVVDGTPDPPERTNRLDPAREAERKRQYVREMAAEFGWRIVEGGADR